VKIAIIGSGIAGLAAARALAPAHQVTLLEANAEPGGHVVTHETHGLAVDMGFIVWNRENYPHFGRMLDELGVASRPTAMAFSVSDGDFEWSSASLSAMFAQRMRLVDPRHWSFLRAVLAFLRQASHDLGSAEVARGSLDDYLARRAVSAEVRERFVIPLAAALWSLAPDRCGEFPAETYLRFLDQHGMLRAVRPLRWHTIVGGARRYVDALLRALARQPGFELALATPVRAIRREPTRVLIDASGRELAVDRVIVATHADAALALLADPSEDERRVLGAFRYSSNRTVLHTDRSFLPRARAAHASWNYVADRDRGRVAVTYSMTKLQGLPDTPYLVTLNPRREPAGALHERAFRHPQFDRAALAAQADVPRLGGALRTYFAGAYLGFGFHEDGMRAGLAAAARAIADEGA